MSLSKEKDQQIQNDAKEMYPVDSHSGYESQIGYLAGATVEAEKTEGLVAALKKIECGYDNDSNRPGVHIGYSGAKEIAQQVLTEYSK